MKIKKIDHMVITVADPKITAAFYEAIGFTPVQTGSRTELLAGDFKINVHTAGRELSPRAQKPSPGSADFCLETDAPLEQILTHLRISGISSETGIVTRHGVRGEMRSLYLRDPDGNLVELCQYEDPGAPNPASVKK